MGSLLVGHRKEVTVVCLGYRVELRHDRTPRGSEALHGRERAIGMGLEGGDTAIRSSNCFVQAVKNMMFPVQHQPRWTRPAISGLGDSRKLLRSIGLCEIQGVDRATIRGGIKFRCESDLPEKGRRDGKDCCLHTSSLHGKTKRIGRGKCKFENSKGKSSQPPGALSARLISRPPKPSLTQSLDKYNDHILPHRYLLWATWRQCRSTTISSTPCRHSACREHVDRLTRYADLSSRGSRPGTSDVLNIEAGIGALGYITR